MTLKTDTFSLQQGSERFADILQNLKGKTPVLVLMPECLCDASYYGVDKLPLKASHMHSEILEACMNHAATTSGKKLGDFYPIIINPSYMEDIEDINLDADNATITASIIAPHMEATPMPIYAGFYPQHLASGAFLPEEHALLLEQLIADVANPNQCWLYHPEYLTFGQMFNKNDSKQRLYSSLDSQMVQHIEGNFAKSIVAA